MTFWTAPQTTYHPGDVNVINNIIMGNGLNWTPNTPAGWTGCTWSDDATNKRIIELDITSKSLRGTLNVSGLEKLQQLLCYSNQLTELDIAGLTKLRYLYCNSNQLTALDLTGIELFGGFSGINQQVSLTMQSNGAVYTTEITLNTPANLTAGITYNSGILTSTSKSIASSPFTVATGGVNGEKLSGTLNFTYVGTGINTGSTEPDNVTVTGYFDLLGRKLQEEPAKELYIIRYDNGTSKKVSKKINPK